MSILARVLAFAAVLAGVALFWPDRAAAVCIGRDLFSTCYRPGGTSAQRQGGIRVPQADVVIESPEIRRRPVLREAPRPRVPAPFRTRRRADRSDPFLPCVGALCGSAHAPRTLRD